MDVVEINTGRGNIKSVIVGSYDYDSQEYPEEKLIRRNIFQKRRFIRSEKFYRRYRRVSYVHVPHRSRFNKGMYVNTKGCLYGYNESYPYSRIEIRFERFDKNNLEYAFITSEFRNVKNETIIVDEERYKDLGRYIRSHWTYVDRVFRTY